MNTSFSLARHSIFAFLTIFALSAGVAIADSGRPVRIIVGFPAGGGTDVVARVLADKLRDELGAPVIVENRPGAGGQVAAQTLKSAPADGTAFFFTNDHTVSILPLVVANPGFSTSRDFAPVAGVATLAAALALGPESPAKTFAEYVTWMRGQGGKGSVGIPAPASMPEFMVKAVGDHFKLDLVAAPYRGAAPMLSDLMGQQITAGIASINDFVEAQKAGKIRIVAVTGKARHLMYPSVPTFSELGVPGFEQSPFYALYSPVATPKPVIERVSLAVKKVLSDTKVRERLMSLGLTIEYSSPRDLEARERDYSKAWGALIKASGYVPQ